MSRSSCLQSRFRTHGMCNPLAAVMAKGANAIRHHLENLVEKGATDEACVDQSTENEAVAGLAEPRRRRILLPERGTAAVRRKCGRNVGPWVYTVGVPDVKWKFRNNML
jgi:hypothetical protein